MTTTKTAWLFDVDGVLTDPEEKKVTETELFPALSEILESGEAVCLNTGRDLGWVEEKVLKGIKKNLQDISSLEHFMFVGEFGGVWTIFDKKGQTDHKTDQDIFIPDELREKIKKLVDEKYADVVFYDKKKKTMISLEVHLGYDLQAFQEKQRMIIEEVKRLLERIEQPLEIKKSVISVDILHPKASKALGADRFLQFLHDKKIHPSEFVAFGDSASDLEMADELEKKGQKVTFVFVGDQAKLGDVKKNYKIKFVPGFTKGTLEYLKR